MSKSDAKNQRNTINEIVKVLSCLESDDFSKQLSKFSTSDETLNPVIDKLNSITQLFKAQADKDTADRKQIVNALHESEASLLRAQRIAHVGSWEWDIEANKVSWSDEMCRIYGVDPTTFDFTLEGVTKVVHPDDLWKQEHAIKELFAGRVAKPFQYRVVRKDGLERVIEVAGIELNVDKAGRPQKICGVAQDVTERKRAKEELERRVNERTAELKLATEQMQIELSERKRTEEQLRRIEWMLSDREVGSIASAVDDQLDVAIDSRYGDLTELNRERTILTAVGKPLLTDMVHEYLNLLETSAAIYEKNGDYALGIFTSKWCRFMDLASRKLCNTDDNVEALNSGKWLCHESCWSNCSKISIATQIPVDIECNGGIRLYAVPIFSGEEVIGSLNFGYSSPLRDPIKLRVIADLYKVEYEELCKVANSYDDRPPYIIELAQKHLITTAKLIGELVGRKRAEEAFQMLEMRANQTLDNIPDLIWMKDIESRMILANEAYGQTCGLKSQDMVGKFDTDFWPKELAEKYRTDDCEVIASGQRKLVVETIVDKDGQTKWVETIKTPILNKSGEVIGTSGIARDITERKRAEAAILKAKEDAEKALSIKSRFLDIAAHELRTPITSLSLLLQLAQRSSTKGLPVDGAYLARLQAPIERMHRLVVDLLDIARLERGIVVLRSELTNMVSLISGCVEEFQMRNPDRRFIFDKPSQTIELEVDPVRMHQVISNLLDNAVKYTPKEGSIQVALKVAHNMLRMSVTDQGVGIPKEQQEELFTPFFRGSADSAIRASGLGLGLSICRSLIELHGGKIDVCSKEAQGSTFYFELPMKETHS